LVAEARDAKLKAIRGSAVAIVNGAFGKAVTFEPGRPGVLFEHDLFAAAIGWQTRIKPDPRLNRKGRRLEGISVGNLRIAIGAVEAKTPADFSRGVSGATLQTSVVVADEVGRAIFSRPPTDQASHRRGAGRSLGDRGEPAQPSEQNKCKGKSQRE